MKILCYVNHHHGDAAGFDGRSTAGSDAGHRRELIAQTLRALRALPGAEVQVCGIDGHSLVPIDLDFPQVRDEPTKLVYESLAHQSRRLDDGYDYFVNIEDDILLPAATLTNVVRFDQDSLLNEVLLPNRLESSESGELHCPDLEWMPGWTYQRRRHEGREIRIALNPHSGLLILSRAKFQYALRHLDTEYRGRLIGAEMASALAYYHSPFCLYRYCDDPSSQAVTHLDRWAGQPLLPDTQETECDDTIDVLLARQTGRIDTLQARLAQRERQTAELEAKLDEERSFRASVLASRSWRATALARRAGGRLAGSRR